MPTMAQVELSVVVVNWNTRDIIGRCLDAVPAAAAGRSTEIIVVDNASADDSAPYLREYYPHVWLIEAGSNLGYARGAQLGIEQARGEFVAVMNPDVVLAPGALDHLVRTLEEHPSAVWTGPRIVTPQGLVQSGPFPLCPIGDPLRTTPVLYRLYQGRRRYRHDRPQRCERLSGAVMLFRASLLRSMGGLPDSTFMFGEEILLGARCRDHGFEVWYDPLCSAVHEHGVSVKQLWGEEARKLATHAGYLTSARQAVAFPHFLAYDMVLIGTLIFKLLLGLLGRPFPVHYHWRYLRLALGALFRAPALPPATSASLAAAGGHRYSSDQEQPRAGSSGRRGIAGGGE